MCENMYWAMNVIKFRIKEMSPIELTEAYSLLINGLINTEEIYTADFWYTEVFSKKVIINLDKIDDIIDLECLSDIHIGHVGFDEKHYIKRVKAIANSPTRVTLFGGDQFDAINIYDKRYNPDAVNIHEIDEQRQRFIDLTNDLLQIQKSRSEKVKIKEKVLDRITGEVTLRDREVYKLKKNENAKILGLMHGNHEYKIREITRAYIENHLCYPYGIDFMGAKCYFVLEIRYKGKVKGQWNIMAMHGSGGGTPETMLKDMKQNNYMDVFLCAHLHQKFYKEEEVIDLDPKTGKAWRRPIYLANMGTFCEFMTEGVSGYGDTKNKVIGTPIGTATISFNTYQGKVSGHI